MERRLVSSDDIVVYDIIMDYRFGVKQLDGCWCMKRIVSDMISSSNSVVREQHNERPNSLPTADRVSERLIESRFWESRKYFWDRMFDPSVIMQSFGFEVSCKLAVTKQRLYSHIRVLDRTQRCTRIYLIVLWSLRTEKTAWFVLSAWWRNPLPRIECRESSMVSKILVVPCTPARILNDARY